jgi:hypothetical protein
LARFVAVDSTVVVVVPKLPLPLLPLIDFATGIESGHHASAGSTSDNGAEAIERSV